MQADAARTPFDTATLVKSNEYLISAGENAEYSRKTILALGDAVAATGGGSAELERMAQNLQQVANQGKATSVDIKQFAMAGINIYQVLADYTGKSVQDVQSMTITYDVLTQALQAAAEEGGRYYDSMATQSQTLNGRLSTLKDNATQLAGVVMEDLTTAFGEAVTKWQRSGHCLQRGLADQRHRRHAGCRAADHPGTVHPRWRRAGLHRQWQTSCCRCWAASAGRLSPIRPQPPCAGAQAALNAVMNANPSAFVVTLLGGSGLGPWHGLCVQPRRSAPA